MRGFLLAPAVLAVSINTVLAEVPGLSGGHVKLQGLATHYPEDSVFRPALGAVARDQNGELRLKFAGGSGRWGVQADYQLLARFGDSLALGDSAAGLATVPDSLPTDDRRWWDLTDEISNDDSRAIEQRLDRLSVDYTGPKTVLRLGRQAVSWGNGLMYNPMDVFNPFDPAAVDTEYKTGDDMLYAQYLLDSGSDWQLVRVQRRDEAGDVTEAVSSTAVKLHGFATAREYDLLLAQHYDQGLLAAGGTVNMGEAVVRGDVVASDSVEGWTASLVANWSYSWVWGGYNVSAVAEYFFNGFGLREEDYSVAALAPDTALGRRLARGELFTVGRHYLASSLQVEVTPLVNLTPNVFLNLGDGSALAQLVARWDVGQNWQLLGALNMPLGEDGTEYGGLETGAGRELSTGAALFAQLAFYF